jgi:ornithine cyclodeaminase
LQFIDSEKVHAVLDYPSLVAGLKSEHIKGIDQNKECFLGEIRNQGPENNYNVLPAWRYGEAIGTKLVTIFPENRKLTPAVPSIHSLYVLFDGANGKPLALIDGDALTFRKTAADSALGADFLARPDVETFLMVGAGALAPHVVEAHLALRPSIRRVSIWNRNPQAAQELARDLRDRPLDQDRKIEAISEIETAAREADLISCATMTDDPLILGDWLKPGCHLDLIGGWKTSMRESDDRAAARSRIFVDSKELCHRCGDIAGPIANGAIDERDILGDLFTLSRGEVQGRLSDQDITFFKNGGGGHLDLFTALVLMQRSENRA